jgi:hypothetical protein
MYIFEYMHIFEGNIYICIYIVIYTDTSYLIGIANMDHWVNYQKIKEREESGKRQRTSNGVSDNKSVEFYTIVENKAEAVAWGLAQER